MRISIAKQPAKGRLTVRERIALLLDENTFKEIGSIAGAAEYDGDGNLVTFTHAARVIGYGRINNRMVCVEGGVISPSMVVGQTRRALSASVGIVCRI